MTILVTGANGFLGYYLTRHLLDRSFEVVATGKGECRLPWKNEPGFNYASMDVTDDFSVLDILTRYQPDVIVHAGAMSKPDECEEQQWLAYLTNVAGTISLLKYAQDIQAFFLYVSTDFVFDGIKGMYSETDEPAPVNYYGHTKAAAESEVKKYAGEWAIARTVLVYGKPQTGKANLLSVVRDKLTSGESYSVFNDQFRTPTYVEDLAAGLIAMIEKRATGIFHLSGTDILTPYEMAVHTATLLRLPVNLIHKITAPDLVQPALRPPRTGFNIDKARKILGFNPRSFEEGLTLSFS